MTRDESQEKREQWIIDYLYGDLSEAEKNTFQDALKRDTQLQQLYDEHCVLDSIVPKGTQPIIDDDRIQGLRWAALRRLRVSRQPSLWQKIASIWPAQISIKRHMQAMAVMFVIGYLTNAGLRLDPAKEELARQSSTDVQTDSFFSLVNSEDYHVVDMDLKRYDEAKGDVEFSFGLISPPNVKGNLHDPYIRQLLLKTFATQSQDQLRLELTSILGLYLDAKDVRASLIDTLLNDPNPGVRYNAVENLVKVSERPGVRMALLNALVHDVNPGIRVEAFLATSTNVDEALIRVLKNHSIDDANSFIRERSKRILHERNDGEGRVEHGVNHGINTIDTKNPESI